MIAFDAMNAIKEINTLERLAVVEPGVVNDHLRDACAEHGLWYPPDPASAPWSTIGGNVATNAGGCVASSTASPRTTYWACRWSPEPVSWFGSGVELPREWLGLISRRSWSAPKALSVITEVTVKLRPQRDPERTIVGYFDSIVAAGKAVEAVAADGLTPSALELIDRQCLLAVDAWKNMGLSADARWSCSAASTHLARSATPKPSECWPASTALELPGAPDPRTRRKPTPCSPPGVWHTPALERLGPVLTEDICVPPKAAVPEMLARIEAISARHDTHIANIAHAGDGNLHPLLITPHDDEAARRRAQAAFAEIIDNALELGGTVTGEHGVGLLKMGGLAQELSPAVVAMHHAIKGALDPPHGIMNPRQGDLKGRVI